MPPMMSGVEPPESADPEPNPGPGDGLALALGVGAVVGEGVGVGVGVALFVLRGVVLPRLLAQFRDDVAVRRLQIRIHNGSDHAIRHRDRQ